MGPLAGLEVAEGQAAALSQSQLWDAATTVTAARSHRLLTQHVAWGEELLMISTLCFCLWKGVSWLLKCCCFINKSIDSVPLSFPEQAHSSPSYLWLTASA